MKSFVTIILTTVFLTTNSFSMEKGEIKEILSVLKQPSKEKIQEFMTKHPKSPFKTFIKKVLVDMSINDTYEIDVDEPFLKLELAIALSNRGLKERSKHLMEEVFKESNFFDEDVILNYPGDRKELFKDEVLKKKIKKALKERDFDKANNYLEFIKVKDDSYKILKAKLLMKTGKRKEAIELLRTIDLPEAKFYLSFFIKDSEEKISLIDSILKSDIERSKKISIAKFVLDRFLVNDLPSFRKFIRIVKRFDKKLYSEYRIKYLIRTAKFKKALNLLKNFNDEKHIAWEIAIKRKFFREKVNFPKDSFSFYRFMLSRKPLSIKWREPRLNDIKDEGIKYIAEENYCDLLSIIDENGISKIDLAIANYMCKNYEKAIKLASLYKTKLDKLPFLLPILYPRPSLFKGDILSLAVARQESLFNRTAVSRSGAIGLMQIMPGTGEYIAKKLNCRNFSTHLLFNDKTNYEFGSFYIHDLLKKTDSLPVAVASYNAGPTRIRKIRKSFWNIKSNEDVVLFVDIFIPIKETRNYVKKVISNYFIYRFITEGENSETEKQEFVSSKEHSN